MRALQRLTSFDAEHAREIHGRNEQGSNLFHYLLSSSRAPLLLELGGFFLPLCERPLRIGPVESNAGSAVLEPIRHQQGRQRRRKTRQRTAPAAGPRLAPVHEPPPGVRIAADATVP